MGIWVDWFDHTEKIKWSLQFSRWDFRVVHIRFRNYTCHLAPKQSSHSSGRNLYCKWARRRLNFTPIYWFFLVLPPWTPGSAFSAVAGKRWTGRHMAWNLPFTDTYGPNYLAKSLHGNTWKSWLILFRISIPIRLVVFMTDADMLTNCPEQPDNMVLAATCLKTDAGHVSWDTEQRWLWHSFGNSHSLVDYKKTLPQQPQ